MNGAMSPVTPGPDDEEQGAADALLAKILRLTQASWWQDSAQWEASELAEAVMDLHAMLTSGVKPPVAWLEAFSGNQVGSTRSVADVPRPDPS